MSPERKTAGRSVLELWHAASCPVHLRALVRQVARLCGDPQILLCRPGLSPAAGKDVKSAKGVDVGFQLLVLDHSCAAILRLLAHQCSNV